MPRGAHKLTREIRRLTDRLPLLAAAGLAWVASPDRAAGDEPAAAPLPPGIRVVWDLAKAWRESTPTRERVCLNGLWRWQPAEPADAGPPPATNWGHFKVPGCWPGITDYMQKDCQTLHAHPAWKNVKPDAIAGAWYQREITIPAAWEGRRISLHVECLNSLAAVYVDGNRAGELRFPGGEVGLTALCRPGGRHLLGLRVAAMPLKAVMLSHGDSASAREVQGTVARRGLCGDVCLVATPRSGRIADVMVTTSVRKGTLGWNAALEGLAPDARYRLECVVMKDGHDVARFTGGPFQAGDLRDGRIGFCEPWNPGQLWDLHTPANTFQLRLSLLDAAGKLLDQAWDERFGFRELWIEGRDFILNGTRVALSCVPLDNAQVGAAWATCEGARESLERLKGFGINFVYTHNYGCEPGAHLGFGAILRAADDVGMLVALSQPHFSAYDWKAPGADRDNGYARHAAAYVRTAGNHPSVVCYAMSHNATGYNEDMNPDLIDGIQDRRDQWARNNARLALRAAAIVGRLDPGRIVYHHASGNLGPLHAINFYPNFVPVQELSDWFGHWATHGVKPLFLCEYGAPFTWDWTMYRGWYQGRREFGSARVPWEFCLAEWNAQFLGDKAYRISAAEAENLRWEARQLRAGNSWHRWDYPCEVGSTRLEERYPVFAAYLTDNWRAFRTWGVSALSPWEYGHYWKLRGGVAKGRRELPVDWENLQRPGFSADFLDERYERMDLAFERADWVATPAAAALLRNNRPLLAWLAGKPEAFTGKDHVFLAGEAVEKQLVVINSSREPVTCRAEWSLALAPAARGGTAVTVAPGAQARIPLRFELPAALAPGAYQLRASVDFGNGEVQDDALAIDVLAPPPAPRIGARVALFDPRGETGRWLRQLGVAHQAVDADADLAAFDLLVVGKAALAADSPAPDIGRVRDGLKVLVFEQTAEVLEKRFGFRVAEYGLRQVFPRVPDHPALAGLGVGSLRDWRGDATLTPPRLQYQPDQRYNGAPTVEWCGLPVTRLWRCGNRGSVATVLIEKPACGDFLPILDGGYGLHYGPLLEHREGRGMVMFCQMDVTGRSEADPAAEALARNLLTYAAAWRPTPPRSALYAGDPAGKKHLESAGVPVAVYQKERLSPGRVLVVGPGAGRRLAGDAPAIAEWLAAGGRLLAIGLGEAEANALLPFKVSMADAEHIAACFSPHDRDSLLAGVAPADVHNRDPRELPLLTAGARIVGNGVLAVAPDRTVVFCQLAPWQFEALGQPNLKRTHRRASCLVTRLLGNLGVRAPTPVLARFSAPVNPAGPERRWLDGLYLDQPDEWDDPYRFFRW